MSDFLRQEHIYWWFTMLLWYFSQLLLSPFHVYKFMERVVLIDHQIIRFTKKILYKITLVDFAWITALQCFQIGNQNFFLLAALVLFQKMFISNVYMYRIYNGVKPFLTSHKISNECWSISYWSVKRIEKK